MNQSIIQSSTSSYQPTTTMQDQYQYQQQRRGVLISNEIYIFVKYSSPRTWCFILTTPTTITTTTITIPISIYRHHIKSERCNTHSFMIQTVVIIFIYMNILLVSFALQTLERFLHPRKKQVVVLVWISLLYLYQQYYYSTTATSTSNSPTAELR